MNKPTSVFDFFDGAFCVTVDTQSRRARLANAQFKDIGLQPQGRDVEFITSKKTTPYQSGCTQGHKKCIKLAKERNYKNVLIFEDDVAFINYNAPILRDALQLLPDTWQLFFLGGRIKPQPKHRFVSEHLLKTRVLETHAYAVNSSIFDEILSWDIAPTHHLPQYYATLTECFTIFPLMTLQVDPKQSRRCASALLSNLRTKYMVNNRRTP
jgi:GR25 family glycosyltransferase involved in LPS biosynthesis